MPMVVLDIVVGIMCLIIALMILVVGANQK